MALVYEEFIEFIAAGTTPAAIVAFKPSPQAQMRFEELLMRNKQGGMTAEESSELSHALEMEHLVRLAKARAWQHIQNQ